MKGLQLILAIFLYFSFVPTTFAEENEKIDDIKVSAIKIKGLTKSKYEIVHNELGLELGQRYNKLAIEQAVQRVRNINLFTNVSYSIKNQELHLQLEERWTTIPILKFAAGGGVRQLTAGVYDPNVFGRYIELGGQFQKLQETNSGVLWFKNPRLFGRRQGLDIQAWKINRLRTKFDQTRDQAIAKAGFLHIREKLYFSYFKEFKPHLRLDGIYEYHHDQFSNKIVPDNLKNTATTLLPPTTKYHLLGAKITLGNINYNQHLVDGLQLSFLGQYGISELAQNKNFFSTQWKGEYFKTIRQKHTFAQRILLGGTNTETIQYWFYLGGLDRIRGFADNRFAGRFYWLSNTEYRYVFYRNNWLTLQSVAFLDLVDTQEQFTFLNKLGAASAGAGLRFFFPKVYRLTARVDYAKALVKDDENAVSFGVQQFF